jgi:NAD(P)-dependent dehydrogenase (short-subunit alcohol dehydrogenase family)
MNRGILITGGGKRVGAALARGLAKAGYAIAIHYQKSAAEADALAGAIREDGGACTLLQADLNSRADIETLVPRAIDALGPLFALINNASGYRYDRIGSLDPEIWDENLRTNLEAPLFLAKAFASSRGSETGAIVNMLDFKVANLNPDYFSYTTAKIAMAGATRLLAMEFGGRIRVNGIAPGLTLRSGKQTEDQFQRAWRATPLGYGPTADDLARTARYLIETRSVNGQIIGLDAGAGLLPRQRDISVDPLALAGG